jgi:hypothetical protein
LMVLYLSSTFYLYFDGPLFDLYLLFVFWWSSIWPLPFICILMVLYLTYTFYLYFDGPLFDLYLLFVFWWSSIWPLPFICILMVLYCSAKFYLVVLLLYKNKCCNICLLHVLSKNCHDRMVVGFTTTCAISAYHH